VHSVVSSGISFYPTPLRALREKNGTQIVMIVMMDYDFLCVLCSLTAVRQALLLCVKNISLRRERRGSYTQSAQRYFFLNIFLSSPPLRPLCEKAERRL
jgi:hypothetical protein